MTIREIVPRTIPYNDRSRPSCLTSLKTCCFRIFEPCTCISSPFYRPIFCHKISTLSWDKSCSFWINYFELKFSSNCGTYDIWYNNWGLSTWEKQELSNLYIIANSVGYAYFF
jgi:hypothetical protein